MHRTQLTYLFIILLLAVSAGTATAQSGSEKEEESPFKNDPFFASPISDLLQKPSDTLGADDRPDEVRRYFIRLNESGIDYNGALESGPYKSSGLYSSYPNLPMIHFNRVDALFLGIREERMQWYPDLNLFGIDNIHPHGMIGYSFGQNEWHYTLGLEKFIGKRRHVMVGAEYHKATATDDHWRVGLTETTLTAFTAGYDFIDYYKQQGWGFYALMRTERLFEGGVAFSNDRFTSVDQATGYALFGSGNRYRINPPVEISGGNPVEFVDISALTFSASFNPKRLVLSRHFTFSLNAAWENAGNGLAGSDYAYDKITGELIGYINFEPGGVFKYRLKAGGITGRAPLLKTYELGGIGSLRALPYKAMGGANEMVLSNAEVQFGKTRSYTGDKWIDFDHIMLSIFLDSGWTDYNERLERSGNIFTGFDRFRIKDLRHNAGVSLGSNLVRCELAWDLDNTARAPVFWIRLNPTF